MADTDTDHDGTADCHDLCPIDPNKTEPGICGCGTLDTDTDGDGTADCDDNCPTDPNKTTLGICGCGVADTIGSSVFYPRSAVPTRPGAALPTLCGPSSWAVRFQ